MISYLWFIIWYPSLCRCFQADILYSLLHFWVFLPCFYVLWQNGLGKILRFLIKNLFQLALLVHNINFINMLVFTSCYISLFIWHLGVFFYYFYFEKYHVGKCSNFWLIKSSFLISSHQIYLNFAILVYIIPSNIWVLKNLKGFINASLINDWYIKILLCILGC